MRKLIIICVAAGVMLVIGIPVINAANVLNFDDITNLDIANINVPNGYGELDWSGFKVIPKDYWPNSGFDNGTVSGNYVAYNSFARSVSVYNGEFDFVGAYLTAAWNNDLNINIQGFSGVTLLYSTTVVVGPWGPAWFNFNYCGIDKLIFTSYGGTNAGLGGGGEHFVVDNFTYIPEPATLLLLGIGAAIVKKRGIERFFEKF
jgi:hypothetical protein